MATHTLHVAFLASVAHGGVVVSTVASTREAHIVFFVESIAEEDVIPVGVYLTQLVYLGLRSLAQGAPSTILVGLRLTERAEYACHATLVFTIGIV